MQEKFCNPYVYYDFYESSVGLNFLVFVCVFLFYKILFLTLFFTYSKK